MSVAVHALGRSDRRSLDALLDRLAAGCASATAPEVLADARRTAYTELPAGLVRFLDRFRRSEPAGAAKVTGFAVDDARIGPTPAHWRERPDPRSTLREELYLVLLASVLGDVFGWETLQGGRLVQDVVPIRDQEEQQSGHGSRATLAWHVEDAFHPYRGDYLGLLALRNDDGVATVVGTAAPQRLPERQRRVLAQPRFVIRSDDEHLHQRLRDGPAGAPAPEDWADPPPAAVLFGHPDRPYVRIDPIFMSALDGDDEAAEALAALVGQIEGALEEVVLGPGDVCLVDNYRAVHGRRSFVARYEGRDRWLKKVAITRDLRKSRGARAAPDARVVAATALAGEGR